MTLTSSGPMCDVCGKYILPVLDEHVNAFGCKGIEETLHCHDRCRDALILAGKDWTRLPEGPLRTAFEKAVAEREG